MQADYDKELQSYFTDVEHLREMFRQWLTAPTLPKRLLVIHGVGGVGKSSLLRMFRLHCKGVCVPVALASGDEQKSALDVLVRWADDLIADGIRLPAFARTLAHYRALLSRAEDEASKVATKVAKEAVKTATEMALGLIPGIGPILSKLGGIGAEALTDWLLSRGFKKPEVDLILKPEEKLTEDFLSGVTKASGKRRLVLMLDTFEQITALSDWMHEVAQRLPSNVLLVIAGRVMPDWERKWPGWMARAHVEELKPMTEDHMRELIRRYYATLRGGEPDPKQVEAIVAFARGLPMVATGVVNTWVRFPDTAGNFQAAKPYVVADFVRYLMDGVPGALVPILEVAAILRWFNSSILRSLLTEEEIHNGYQAVRAHAPKVSSETETTYGPDYELRYIYDEILRFPFVRYEEESAFFHDAVREIVDENLRVHHPERHYELHERAAAYFEAQLEKASSADTERIALERLYHRIRADEDTGIRLFQEMAEQASRYGLRSRLRSLLDDVNSYGVYRLSNALWIRYYCAVLSYMEGKELEAEQEFQIIAENEQADKKLQSYTLCDWGQLLQQRRTGNRSLIAKAIECHRRSLQIAPLDGKLVHNLLQLARIYRDLGNWDVALEYLQQALSFYTQRNDRHGEFLCYLRLYHYYAYLGDWKQMFFARNSAKRAIVSSEEFALRYAEWLCSMAIAWIWAGRYSEVISNIEKSAHTKKKFGENPSLSDLRDIGLAFAFIGKPRESMIYLKSSMKLSEKKASYSQRERAVTLGFLGTALLKLGHLQKAQDFLEQSRELKIALIDTSYLLDTLIWLGVLFEIKGIMNDSVGYYQECLKYRWTGRRYFECGALTGLIRVKHAQGDYAAIPPLLAEAEQLAQQYEYNDHLASLRLTQGHIAWEGNAPTWENGFEAAMRYYQQALVYALRYNRFLLDEVLSGRPQGTPLRPIIPECLKHGEEGRRMLITLRDWWQTGVNDIGAPRPDTISPIPEGIPLLEAERIARQREPGNGSPQRSVVEQIENALSTYLL